MSFQRPKWIQAVLPRQQLQASDGPQDISIDSMAAPCLRIQPWRRLLPAAACLLPLLLMLGGLLSQGHQLNWSQAFAVACCIGFILAFGWLFARVYSLGSIAVDGEGVSQSFLRLRGPLRQQLSWEQVQRVRYQRGVYRFHGADGSEMQLGIMLLPNAEVVVHALRQFMPQRLLTQLGLRRH